MKAVCQIVLLLVLSSPLCQSEGDVHKGGHWVPVDYSDGDRKPPKPVIPESPTVHVLIAAYRDKLCGRTVAELFNYSATPDKLTVGVIEQFEEGDMRCLEDYCRRMEEMTPGHCPYKNQIRIKELPAHSMHGPMHARSFSGELLGDEDFCLQVDAHTQPTKNWDTRLIEEWSHAENEYAVLSTYLQRVEDMASREIGSNINNWHEVPLMCSTVGGMFGMVRNQQASAGKMLTRPLRSCFWGAGFSFSKCHAERRVPHDPHTRGVFDGEEFTRAIRLFTHGYDVYAPSHSLLFHDYTVAQSDPKKWHAGSSGGKSVQSYARLKGFLGLPQGIPQNMGKYGFGTVRTKEQYEQQCGMNLSSGWQSDNSRCGDLRWVPFVEATKPSNTNNEVLKPVLPKDRLIPKTTTSVGLMPIMIILTIIIAFLARKHSPMRPRVD
eukprot:TRINITY_DN9218_c0_g1_i1.p1 TRINITY_DN9218_c0_g1~~TRINITY_DN9218_c0_g1_i1.p1  ORF type:complete len:435 (+),score=55.09 TRINITY_DN9218_c0_g1_i1:63-1367(+)